MFRTPLEVAQSELRQLRVFMVEALQEVAALYPLFDSEGSSRVLLLDTAAFQARDTEALEPGHLLIVGEFPMDIHAEKAIYARPIQKVWSLDDYPPERLGELWFLDPWDRLRKHPGLSDATRACLEGRNLSGREPHGEPIVDLYFSRDLKRLKAASTRRPFFRRGRLEVTAIKPFLAAETS